MYKDFYGFTTYPFALTPDPQFLYPSENYNDCLFHLLRALEREDEFLVLTGEIGTGKTLLLNTMIERLDEKIHVVFLASSQLQSLGILECTSRAFGLETNSQSTDKILLNLKNFLSTHAKRNEKILLIIDEAQNISVDTMRDLVFLMQFNKYVKKLLQVIFVGQPRIDDILKRREFSQFIPYVAFSCRLMPMNYNETKLYIEKRLSVSGVRYIIFTSKAMKEIFVCSKGIPRAINIICDLALLFGLNDGAREIGRSIIKRVMQELHVHTPEKPLSRYTDQKRDTNQTPVAATTDDQGKKPPFLLRWGMVCTAALLFLAGLFGSIQYEYPMAFHTGKPELLHLPRLIASTFGAYKE